MVNAPDHVFHTIGIAYCQQNLYVLLAIYTELFTLKYKRTDSVNNIIVTVFQKQ